MFSFEWDEDKNKFKSFGYVSLGVALPNPKFYCFGKIDGEILTVRFTYRNNKIRIIGAGYWRQGKKIYEKENKIHK